MPMTLRMKVLASPEARSFIRARGGLLFVEVVSRSHVHGALRVLHVSTDPPQDALEWQRVETKGFLLFLPPGLRRPSELHLEVRGWMRRRLKAFWEGCVYVV